MTIDGTGTLTATGALSASNLSGTNTGDVTLGSVQATSVASGSSLVGQQLRLHVADAANAGLMSTTTQSFAGNKTFNGDLTAGTALSLNGTVFTLDANNATAGLDLDIVANQGSDADGILRYSATNNRWELSNDGGAFTAISTGAGSLTGTGAAGRVAFWTGASTLDKDDTFFWDNTTKKLGIGISATGGKLHVQSTDPATIGLLVRGAVSQTADLQQWQDNSNNVLARITNSGDLRIRGNGGTATIETDTATTVSLFNGVPTTVNFAGAATALNIGATSGTTLVKNSLTTNGSVILGDASTDTVSFAARVNTPVIPAIDNSADLGSATNRWRDLHLTGDLNLFNGSGNVTADAANADGNSGTVIDTGITIGAGTDRPAITVVNTKAKTTSVILASICSAPTPGARLTVAAYPEVADGAFKIQVSNVGGQAQNPPYKICYMIIN